MEYHLTNNKGMTVMVINTGARILSIKVPVGNERREVITGPLTEALALQQDAFTGAVCGRFANRIANGSFELNGRRYALEVNNGSNHLHGGSNGFHAKSWEARPVEMEGMQQALEFSLLSPDGDAGYPGNLQVKVTYALNNDNELHIHWKAVTDQPTLVNLTSHPYFNLMGTGDILDHRLQVRATRYTPLSATGVPDGRLVELKDTPLDFSSLKAVGEATRSSMPDILQVGGLDHNWVLDERNPETEVVAQLLSPDQKIKLEVLTSQPGLQIYTGQHMDGTMTAADGSPIPAMGGMALESQHFPDAPHHPHFPSTVLEPGQTYHQWVIYRFVSL